MNGVPIWGYPQPGKHRSCKILEPFCRGAGGFLCANSRLVMDTAAAFYGIVGIERLFYQAQRRVSQRGADFYYLDNSYFDAGRWVYFRASRNALQRAAEGPNFDRLEALGISVKPWRRGGDHILVVEQSDYFMRYLAGYSGGVSEWRSAVRSAIAKHTDREIRIRPWKRDKVQASASLAADLEGAWAVVTHASAAANEALLAGIPVFLTGESVALELGSGDLSEIESPRRPDGREEWAARLAASQWTLEEMRAGMAWRALQGEK